MKLVEQDLVSGRNSVMLQYTQWNIIGMSQILQTELQTASDGHRLCLLPLTESEMSHNRRGYIGLYVNKKGIHAWPLLYCGPAGLLCARLSLDLGCQCTHVSERYRSLKFAQFESKVKGGIRPQCLELRAFTESTTGRHHRIAHYVASR